MCTCSNQLLPHDPIPDVCPDKFFGMPLAEWDAYGKFLPCDDCGREDGTHNPEVEH